MSSTYYSNIPVDVSDTNTEIALRKCCVHGFTVWLGARMCCNWDEGDGGYEIIFKIYTQNIC